MPDCCDEVLDDLAPVHEAVKGRLHECLSFISELREMWRRRECPNLFVAWVVGDVGRNQESFDELISRLDRGEVLEGEGKDPAAAVYLRFNQVLGITSSAPISGGQEEGNGS